MTRYFFTRLAGAIPTLFIIITITFFLMRAAPGGPFDQEQALAPEIKANLAACLRLGSTGMDPVRPLSQVAAAWRFRTLVQI